MIRAFSFVRWSRPEQGQGDSLRRQKEASAALCQRHGWALTELPPLKGVGAYRGKQRTTGPLAEFLKLAKDGRSVPKGSVLIVESLDRLTREDIDTAFDFFRDILKAGITIATTSPEYVFQANDRARRMQDLLIALVILCRGNEESALKSDRVSEAWADKRKNAATEKMTASCPAWLQMRADRSAFDEIKTNADTVRLIFRLAVDGYGVFRITRKLNADKVPTFGNKPKRKAQQWYESYVIRILDNRAVLGEFQPGVRSKEDGGHKSIPQGQPIKDYYPAVVSVADFVAARKAIDSRALGFKRTGKDVPNIFGKLIRNARDGLRWLYIPRKKKSPHARMEPIGGRGGVSAPLSFRYADLEAAFLRFLTEVTAADLTGTAKPNNAAGLELKLSDLKGRIALLESRMKTTPDLGALLDELTAWKAEARELEKELADAQNPTDEGAMLADTQAVIDLLKTDPEHYRTKLKQLVHNLVKEMWLLVFEYEREGSRGRNMTDRAALLQVHFKSGHFRSFLVERGAANGKPSSPTRFLLTGRVDANTAIARDNKHVVADLRTYRDGEEWDLVSMFAEKYLGAVFED